MCVNYEKKVTVDTYQIFLCDVWYTVIRFIVVSLAVRGKFINLV